MRWRNGRGRMIQWGCWESNGQAHYLNTISLDRKEEEAQNTQQPMGMLHKSVLNGGDL